MDAHLLLEFWYLSFNLPKRIFTVRNSSCGKVMFSQASVILSTGGRVWQRGACVVKGGMHGKGGCMVKGACVAKGRCVW